MTEWTTVPKQPTGKVVESLQSHRCIHARRQILPMCTPPYRLLFIGLWHANQGVDLFIDGLERFYEADWLKFSALEVYGGG